jgi:hypothetical protein
MIKNGPCVLAQLDLQKEQFTKYDFLGTFHRVVGRRKDLWQAKILDL